MKSSMYIIGSMLLHFFCFLQSNQDLSSFIRNSSPSFGKTHFISGFPHELIFKASDVSAPVRSDDNHHKSKKRNNQKTLIDQTAQVQTFFSPDQDVQHALLELIREEMVSIKMAIYTFTDYEIAQALVDAHKRGVDVQVVIDPSQGKDRYSKIGMLFDVGIPVYFYNPDYIDDKRSNLMHNKFMVFGGNGKKRVRRVWTGSYNFTAAARTRNQENAVLMSGLVDVFNNFVSQFECLKTERSINCSCKAHMYHTYHQRSQADPVPLRVAQTRRSPHKKGRKNMRSHIHV